MILATPVVEKLASSYPGASIDFLTRKGNESLFTRHPLLRKVLRWDKSENKYRNLMTLIRAVRSEKYDCVVNLQRFGSTGLLTGLSGAPVRIGFDKNPFSFLLTEKVRHIIGREQTLHETERNLSLIEQITDRGEAHMRLYPSDEDRENVKYFKNNPFITVAPASVWFTKQFPEEKWVDFLRNAGEKCAVYLLGSKNDHELCERIRAGSGRDDVKNLAGALSLLETAALMEDAAMNFVNDSAPTHLASAVNAPVTTVFCSTVPEFGFGPLSDDSAIVELQEMLYCRPCGLHGFRKCPEGHFKCALNIETEQLLNRLP